MIPVFLLILLEFTAFGMIIPLSPYLSRDFGADDLQVGLLMSVYSLAQLITAPFWGGLSDRLGRKPVILLCLLGSSVFYLWFAFAHTLSSLFLTRILAGVFGGTMPVAMACIADLTGEKSRSKNMGLAGAGIGLGFMIGPFAGGALGLTGQSLGSIPPFGSSFSAVGAWGISLLNLLMVFFFFKESFSRPATGFKNILIHFKNTHQSRFSALAGALKLPVLKQVLCMHFFLTLALAGVEASLFLYVRDKLSWSLFPASLGFAYIGLIMVLTQGLLVRKVIPMWGEHRVVLLGLLVAGLGFAGVGWTSWLWFVTLSVTLLCVGYGLSSSCLSGAVSLLTKKSQQGGVLGVHQSVFSLGRILGPALGGWFYRDLSPSAPFYLSGLLAFLALGLGFYLHTRFPQKGKTTP